MADRLKLRAEDAEDIAVISSGLQDALVAVADMAFLRAERRFALVVNRFCWEREPDVNGHFQRTHAAIAFDTVSRVAVTGIDRTRPERILDLLGIETIAAADGRQVIVLHFAGRAAIRLEVDRILCHLEDVGEPWPTRWKPEHPVD